MSPAVAVVSPRSIIERPASLIERPAAFTLEQAREIAKTSPVAALSALALDKVLANLRRYGNEPDVRHQGALMRVVGGLSQLAARNWTMRRVWPLQVSAGKTQAIVAWLAAVYHLRLPYSVVIAAEKIEALCDIREDLRVNHGVPLSWSGILHSKGSDASMLSTPEHEIPSKQIIFVSHYRVIMKGALKTINTYRGRDRDVLIWDESMIATTAWAINELDFEAQLGWLRPQVVKYPQNEDLKDAVAYLGECLDLLTGELEDQQRLSRAPLALTMPEASAVDIARYADAIRMVAQMSSGSKYRQNVKACLDLLRLSHLPIRVTTAPQRGCAYIAYQVSVPVEFARVGVFDASYPLRTLEQIDKTLVRDPDPDCQGNLITYPNLTIYSLQHGTGYSKVRKVPTQIAQAVAEVVAQAPAASLTFTFKSRGDGFDMGNTLINSFEAEGLDLWTTADAQGLSGDRQMMPRYAMLKWGEHTSLSEFSYCQDVILAGILTRDEHELAASYGAQRSLGVEQDEWASDVTTAEVQQTVLSEQACAAYQALARGSLRVSRHGVAAPMRGWLFHPDHAALKAELDKVFPGAQWKQWNTPHLREVGEKYDKAMSLIVRYLNDQPAEVEEVLIETMRKDQAFAGIPQRTLAIARQRVEQQQLAPWHREGLRMVRTFVATN